MSSLSQFDPYALANGDPSKDFYMATPPSTTDSSNRGATTEFVKQQNYLQSGHIVGVIAFYPLSYAPDGWFKCNGAAVSRNTYWRLFNTIGTSWGGGDGWSTFNLPDLRGEFIRCWDDGRGVDPQRDHNSYQGDDFKSHTHSGTTLGYLGGSPGAVEDSQGYPDWNTGSIGWTGGGETRPRNVALLACIKY